MAPDAAPPRDDAFAPAGLWRRFMSATYETIVLFGVVVFFGYAYSALLGFRGAPGPLRWGFMAWLFVVVGAYFVWFWSEGRRTLPMKTVGLRLVDASGAPVSRMRAAKRYLLGWVAIVVPLAAASRGGPAWLLLLPLPFLWGLKDAQHRTLYDVGAGTRLVVDTRPRP